MISLVEVGVLYNQAIFIDLILAVAFGILSGWLWGMLYRVFKK